MIEWDEAGAGPPLVLVHGNTEDRRMYDTLVPRLAGAFRCVRLDLRGHGESGDADDYSAFAMTEDLATVVREARIDEPPVLVGHSMGAVVVTLYAAQAPVRAVVNVDQGLRFGDFAVAIQPLAAGLRGADFAPALAAVFATLGTEALPPEVRTHAEACHAAARQEVVLGTWDLVLDTSPEELTKMAEATLPSVTAPYLAIHGSDPGDDYVAWLTGLLPDVTVEVWPGCGHYPHLVEPDRFAERVRAFARA